MACSKMRAAAEADKVALNSGPAPADAQRNVENIASAARRVDADICINSPFSDGSVFVRR